ncbi:hypothetical protein Aple_070310 [Acrocarpospora pleiomorpha]|uniref:Uncharacterized protein n=1 Tax=Acrocarpospora pleiomorpha TaxID=90975 RepID=A0A5M3XT08_9ACTN|nr:hypothetical protein [Acrocarpospora pleiomorpha]GES24132.1 hypothetical protein Aple_070310 [Acrocarpospora pleiomorpha]
MDTYWFTIKITGFPEGQLVSISDEFYGLLEESGGVDALIAGDERGGEIEFSREAEDAATAIASAIEQVEQVGLEVVGVTETSTISPNGPEPARRPGPPGRPVPAGSSR